MYYSGVYKIFWGPKGGFERTPSNPPAYGPGRRVTLVTHTHVTDQKREGRVAFMRKPKKSVPLACPICTVVTRSTMTVFLDSMNATRPSLFLVRNVRVRDRGSRAGCVHGLRRSRRNPCLLSYLYSSDNPTITRSTMTVFLDSGTCIILHS